MLQLGLLLIDPFHRQTLLIFLGLTESLILKQTLQKKDKNNATANTMAGKAWNTLRDFCPDFPSILQSEQVEESQSQSADYRAGRLHRKSHSVFFSFRL